MPGTTTTAAGAALETTDGAPPDTAIAKQRKKLDPRILTLIQNGVLDGHRSVVVLIGDHGREQVVNLHFLLAKQKIARPSVLWCYKTELGFSSHRQKRANQIKRAVSRGIREVDEEDPFELFVASTDIRYCYYKDSERILGQTFGMLVLQDFEALTPNLLARTIETVEGGGMIVLLLKTINSLRQLYSMSMDVHSRYRTPSHNTVVPRFNERFILSLGECGNCLVVDDTLTVLPISKGKSIKPLKKTLEPALSEDQKQLIQVKASLKDTPIIGSLLNLTKTNSQASSLLQFLDILSSKSLHATLSLTAARGRGKSALLGLSIAASISYGYSNVFLTSPSPENLGTVWEFLFKGFDALGYQEHLDYDLIQSLTDKSILRVNVFRDHRQTIQYIHPADSHLLSSAELVVVDEAAAIPLPLVKKLLGNYLVMLSSTINGYEGTGRSLSLKLLKELRENSAGYNAQTAKPADSTARTGGRQLKEVQLTTPIRYNPNDPVEAWLNSVLCLDCCDDAVNSKAVSALQYALPHPSQCELFYINRDTLFSYHPVSEAFLRKIMALYVGSHYKNSPNDLMLMSDAPAHHLFVLLPPTTPGKAATPLPEPLVVIQVTLEGKISKGALNASMSRGKRLDGDLIPWVVTQQYQDDEFASLSGARIVRVATHPDFVGMGYGSRALDLLTEYYQGNMVNTSEALPKPAKPLVRDFESTKNVLHREKIAIRDTSTLPPLLSTLTDTPMTEPLHWLGVSYGLTSPLHKFWKRSGFVPVYLRQTPNDLTGEHSCIMLRCLRNAQVGDEWLVPFVKDFRKRLCELLGFQFRVFSPILVLSILDGLVRLIAKSDPSSEDPEEPTEKLESTAEIKRHYSPYDLKRLDSYASNMLDYHVVLDMVPIIAKHYFTDKFPSTSETSNPSSSSSSSNQLVKLSPIQAAILVGVGLQHKTLEDLEKEINLPASQLMALFIKVVRKVSTVLSEVLRKEMDSSTPALPASLKRRASNKSDSEAEDDENDSKLMKRDVRDDEAWDPTTQGLNEDLDDAESSIKKEIRDQQKEIINTLNLSQFTIPDQTSFANASTSKTSMTTIKNPESSRAKRLKTGLAADIAAKTRGDGTGVYDPKGLIKKSTKGKAKKGGKNHN